VFGRGYPNLNQLRRLLAGFCVRLRNAASIFIEIIMECPNCITPWKCNGPHLERMSDSIYKSEHGYFIKKDRQWWTFTPTEKEFDVDTLFYIIDTLRNFNESQNTIERTL
jgi:hypothetical protein